MGALSDWPGLRGLDRLSLDALPDELSSILKARGFPACLTRLSCGDVTSEDCRPLLKAKALRWLTSLDLYPSEMTPAVMTSLCRSPVLQNLDSLYLWSFHENSEVGMALANAPGLPRLRNLVIGSDTDIDVVEALRRRYGPRLRVCCDF
jgi:hypothetical protein